MFPSCHILCPSGILSICLISGFIETQRVLPLAPTGSFELNVSAQSCHVQSPSTSYLKVSPLSSGFLREINAMDVGNVPSDVSRLEKCRVPHDTAGIFPPR